MLTLAKEVTAMCYHAALRLAFAAGLVGAAAVSFAIAASRPDAIAALCAL